MNRRARAIPPTTNLSPKPSKLVAKEDKPVGGQLGKPTGARFRVYERLKCHADAVKGTLYESTTLLCAIDDIFRYPLTSHATDLINRQLKSGIGDHALGDMVIALREEGRLSGPPTTINPAMNRRSFARWVCSTTRRGRIVWLLTTPPSAGT